MKQDTHCTSTASWKDHDPAPPWLVPEPTRSPRPALIAIGVISAVLWLLLTLISRGHIPPFASFDSALPNDEMPTRIYLAIHFLLASIALAPLIVFRKNLSALPLRPIVFFSIVLRLLALPGAPIHENDFHRYLWDGKLAAHGINPFLHAPSDLFDPRLAELRDENSALHQNINHPDIATIYPPVAQAVFATSYLLFGDSLLGLKCLLMAFDLGILGLIVFLLRKLRLPTALALLYAWHPLVIKEIANSAHYDVVPVFFTLLAIALAVGLKKNRLSPALALAAGALSKYFSLLLLPILYSPRQLKNSFIPWTLFAAVVIAAFLPFFLWNDAGIDRVFSGFRAYHSDWTFFPGAFTVILLITKKVAIAKATAGLLLAAVVLRLSLTDTPNSLALVRKCATAIAALLILSPTAFPWYFVWMLPFVCLFPSRAWLLLSLLTPLSYLNFRTDSLLVGSYFLNIPTLTWIIWLPFTIVWFYEKRHCQPLFPPPSSSSSSQQDKAPISKT